MNHQKISKSKLNKSIGTIGDNAYIEVNLSDKHYHKEADLAEDKDLDYFLIDRFELKKNICAFIENSNGKFLINYRDDFDMDMDIISWIKSTSIKNNYKYIHFDLLDKKDYTTTTKEKFEDAINIFIENNPNTFKNFYQRFISDKKDISILSNPLEYFTKILKKKSDNNDFLDVLKKDLKEFTKLIIILNIDSVREYIKIRNIFNIQNIKLIIITTNKREFYDIKVDKKETLDKISPSDLEQYLSLINIEDIEIEKFMKKINNYTEHKELKTMIIEERFKNFKIPPIENKLCKGGKNAI